MRTQREHQREDQDRDRIFDDIVPQQRGGDDPRSHLGAGDLYGNEQRAEGEDDEGKRCRDDGFQQCLRAGRFEAEKAPVKPTPEPIQ